MFYLYLFCDLPTDAMKVVDIFRRIELPYVLAVYICQSHRIQAFTAQVRIVACVEKPAPQVLAEWDHRSVGVSWDHVADFTIEPGTVHTPTGVSTNRILIDHRAVHESTRDPGDIGQKTEVWVVDIILRSRRSSGPDRDQKQLIFAGRPLQLVCF
jgi:hypothetical protein